MKDHVLKRLVNGTFFPVGSVRTILLGPCRGMQIRLSHASGHAVLTGYDRLAQRSLVTHVRRGSTVFDVGANCGQYTLLLARLVGADGRVVACEPVASIFAELVGNVDLNGLSWVHCESAAVAGAEGSVRFLSSPDEPTMGKIDGADPAIHVASYMADLVRATTIDALSQQWGSPEVVKIDTEGAAGEVLAGARNTALHARPAFLIEVHGPVERTAVQAWAGCSGYTVSDLTGAPVEDLADRHVSPVWLKAA